MPRQKSYEKLFIYTVDGATPGARDFFGDELLAEWEDSGTTLLFFESARERQVLDFLSSVPGADYLSETEMDHKNWEAGKPVTVNRVAGFLICPTWDERRPEPGEILITLDPGVAFGTSMHPTTECCLRALRYIFERFTPRRVLDLGCGTGVLSIAALKLGASHSTAVDYTSMATDAARVCFELNGVSERVDLHCDDVFSRLKGDADLVLCNIYIQVIERLLARPDYNKNEWILISGVHGREQREKTLALIADAGREIVKAYEKEDWHTYITRRGSGTGTKEN